VAHLIWGELDAADRPRERRVARRIKCGGGEPRIMSAGGDGLGDGRKTSVATHVIEMDMRVDNEDRQVESTLIFQAAWQELALEPFPVGSLATAADTSVHKDDAQRPDDDVEKGVFVEAIVLDHEPDAR